MEEWQVVAILDRSAGNESVGEMWQETKVFDADAKLIDVLKWAVSHRASDPENFRGNLKLAISQ